MDRIKTRHTDVGVGKWGRGEEGNVEGKVSGTGDLGDTDWAANHSTPI